MINSRKGLNKDVQHARPDAELRLLDKFNSFLKDRKAESSKIQSTVRPAKERPADHSPDALSPKKAAKLIEERLCTSRGKIRLSKAYNGIIAGSANLEAADSLKNHGNVKRLLRQYMKRPSQPLSDQLRAAKAVDCEAGVFVTEAPSALTYDKRVFVPFKDERDHLGRLIDPVHQSYMQLPPQGYIKKQLHVFNNKMYLSDNIPTRWKEHWKREQSASKDRLHSASMGSGLVASHDKLHHVPSSKILGASTEGLPVKNEEYYDKQEQREMQRLGSAMSSVRGYQAYICFRTRSDAPRSASRSATSPTCPQAGSPRRGCQRSSRLRPEASSRISRATRARRRLLLRRMDPARMGRRRPTTRRGQLRECGRRASRRQCITTNWRGTRRAGG